MGILKGLATAIFSFLFFLLLMVFSVAFLVNGTVLSYDFVSNEVDKMPVSSIARDIAEQQLGDELQGSEFLKEVAYRVVENQEPWMKTQMNNALRTGYDYFQGKTNTLAISIPLNELKTNLTSTLWPEATDYLSEQLAGKNDTQISVYIQDIIQDIPWDALAPDLAALTETERNQYIEQYLRDAAGVPPKSGYPTLDISTKIEIDQTINSFISDFVSDMPDTVSIDESSIDPGTMQTLRDVKRGVGYFQTWYPWLIVALVVLMGLIFLVNWGFRTPARALGINLIIIGIIDLVGVLLLRYLPAVQWAADAMQTDISPALKAWIEGLISDITGVMLPLTIGILVVGIVLLVLSFVIPRREKPMPVPVQDSSYTPPPAQPPPPPPPPRT